MDKTDGSSFMQLLDSWSFVSKLRLALGYTTIDA